jgi:hypothetical protein
MPVPPRYGIAQRSSASDGVLATLTGRRRSCPDGSHDAGRADILAGYRRSAGADRAKAGTSGGNSGSNGHVTREAPPSVILRIVI